MSEQTGNCFLLGVVLDYWLGSEKVLKNIINGYDGASAAYVGDKGRNKHFKYLGRLHEKTHQIGRGLQAKVEWFYDFQNV